MEKWECWDKNWENPVMVDLQDVLGLKWEKLEKPWKDSFGDEFPYTIKLFVKNDLEFYRGHYCTGETSGWDFKDMLLHMNELYRYWE